MTRAKLNKHIDAAINECSKIMGATREGKYARALASEGYVGGYQQALSDLQVLMNADVLGSPKNEYLWPTLQREK